MFILCAVRHVFAIVLWFYCLCFRREEQNILLYIYMPFANHWYRLLLTYCKCCIFFSLTIFSFISLSAVYNDIIYTVESFACSIFAYHSIVVKVIIFKLYKLWYQNGCFLLCILSIVAISDKKWLVPESIFQTCIQVIHGL